MIKTISLAGVAFFGAIVLLPTAAFAGTCSIPNAIANGQVADASKIMGDFNAVANCAQQGVTITGTPTTGAISVFSGSGTITGGNLTGDVTTSAGTATTLSSTGVTPGNYASPNITVDAKGRITSASSGSGGGGSGALTLIGSVVTTAGQTSISFTKIPTVFNHLKIIGSVGSTSNSGSNSDAIYLNFNSDTNSADYGLTLSGSYGSGSTFAFNTGIGCAASMGTAGVGYRSINVDIPNYNNATGQIVFTGRGATFQQDVGIFQTVASGYWSGGAAINSITILDQAGNPFQPGSKFWLYGVL